MKTTRKILTTVVCILVLLLANTLTVSATVMPGYFIEDNVPVDEWQDVVDELKFSSFKQEPSVKRAIKSLATDRNVMAICTRSWNKAIILVYNNYGEFVIGYELTTFGRVNIGFDVQGLVIHNISSGHKLYLDDDGDIAYITENEYKSRKNDLKSFVDDMETTRGRHKYSLETTPMTVALVTRAHSRLVFTDGDDIPIVIYDASERHINGLIIASVLIIADLLITVRIALKKRK